MTEEQKVWAVAINVYLNGIGSPDEECHWKLEAEAWAKSESYFPELDYAQFLEVARKYDCWLELEKIVPVA